jgi:hypothetical protein
MEPLHEKTLKARPETWLETPAVEPKTAVVSPSQDPVAKARRSAIKAKTYTLDQLSQLDIFRMHQIFAKYYDGHPFAQFQNDLAEKDHVILLRDVEQGRIKGFSTLMKVEIQTERGTVRGFYSGDTVLEKEYWGSPALGLEFLRFLWIERLKNPFRPLYWFLISKGYKTYLLMANNFSTHYPRFELKTPDYFQSIMNSFYEKKFNGLYDRESGRVQTAGTACRLKEQVAEVTPEMQRLERVAFFQKVNPDWRSGVELACLAEMTIWMPFKYAFKKFFRGMLK